MRLWVCAAAAAAVVVVLVAGCSSSSPDLGSVASGDPTEIPAVSQPKQAPKQDVEEEEGSDEVLSFGETYEGGIDTTITKAEPFSYTTSRFAFPKSGARAWCVELQFANNLQGTFPLALLRISATADGWAAQEVIDSEAGYGGLIMAPDLGPGQTVKVKAAFLGDGDGKHTITVSSLDGSESVTFAD